MALVLVVDDSPTVREQVMHALRPLGHQFVEAENGAVALQRAAEQQAQLVIVDIHMPVLDGIAVIAQLRRDPRYAETPIFVLTTESTNDRVREGEQAGATAWMLKPFNEELLRSAVKEVLG